MEEYLENLKSLRSYMNDVEDEAAKRSAEEQSQKTAIEALENDLKLAKSEINKVNEETNDMIMKKDKVELEIFDKQKKIASLEIECTTLKQTLELLHQEIGTVSKNLGSKRLFYANTTGSFDTGLKDHEEWIQKNKQLKFNDQEHFEGVYGLGNEGNSVQAGIETNEKDKDLKGQLEFAEKKLEELETKRSTLISETLKNKELVEQEKCKIEAVPLALQELDLITLEKEYNLLISDKSGEMEYIQSLQDRINALKEISNDVECQCGVKYKAEITQKN